MKFDGIIDLSIIILLIDKLNQRREIKYKIKQIRIRILNERLKRGISAIVANIKPPVISDNDEQRPNQP